MKKAAAICAMILISPITAQAQTETPKPVKAALSYELPENTCKKPAGLIDGSAIVDNNGVARSYGSDSYKLERQERKKKRWQSCVKKYKSALLKDFDTLKDSAKYGLTQDQANKIMAKMKLIQEVMGTEDGLKPQA